MQWQNLGRREVSIWYTLIRVGKFFRTVHNFVELSKLELKFWKFPWLAFLLSFSIIQEFSAFSLLDKKTPIENSKAKVIEMILNPSRKSVTLFYDEPSILRMFSKKSLNLSLHSKKTLQNPSKMKSRKFSFPHNFCFGKTRFWIC